MNFLRLIILALSMVFPNFVNLNQWKYIGLDLNIMRFVAALTVKILAFWCKYQVENFKHQNYKWFNNEANCLRFVFYFFHETLEMLNAVWWNNSPRSNTQIRTNYSPLMDWRENRNKKFWVALWIIKTNFKSFRAGL